MTIPYTLQSKNQIAILLTGGLSTMLGIYTMLQTHTIMLPSWFLVLFFLPFAILASLGFGFLVKSLKGSYWHTFTFASMFMTGFSLVYCMIEYFIK